MPKGKGKRPERPEIIPTRKLTAPVPELFRQVDVQIPNAIQWVRQGIKELIEEAYYKGYHEGYTQGFDAARETYGV